MRFTIPMILTVVASPVFAAPNVVVDIAPLHGLVSDVMAGVAAPALFLSPQAEPHSYAMRPSDAAMLAQADLVIWIGAELTPWLADPIATLAPDADLLTLLETEGWTLREIADEHEDEDAHDHGDVDPHAWLDPKIASVWVGHIAQSLSAADPDNAVTYAKNAEVLRADLAVLDREIAAQLADVSDRALIWPHAAYGYFQHAYGVTSVGAISQTDGAPAGPQHIAELRELVLAGDAVCVLSDPEVNPRWAAVLSEGTDVRRGTIDGLGVDIQTGVRQYKTLITQLGQSIADCLAP